MTLWEQAKRIQHGVEVLSKWIGSGGDVVSSQDSQARADICNGRNPTGLRCPNNQLQFKVSTPVALAVKQYLAVKKGLNLTVRGEERLGTCALCGCSLRLQVHEPQEKVQAELTDEEKAALPAFCWKLT